LKEEDVRCARFKVSQPFLWEIHPLKWPSIENDGWLVVLNIFSIINGTILPIDEVIFLMVIAPPTRLGWSDRI
jgi:hypothetical protein